MKILFLQKRILYPANTGGRIRTLNIVRHLARWHDVTYLCNVQPEDSPYLDQMASLGVRLVTIPWQETPRNSPRFYVDLVKNLFSSLPFNVAKDFDPALRARAEELLEKDTFDLLICDFVQMAQNAIGLKAKTNLLLQHNVEAQIFERHGTTGGSWLRRCYMAHQSRKMKDYESRAGRHFAAIVAVSEQDKQLFQKRYGWGHVHTIDTAVDTEYFQPNGQPVNDMRVVFVGSLDWLPNEDAVQFFSRQIWPLVRRFHPQAEFQIVGRNPSRAVTRLSRIAGVSIVGTVPDVRPYLAEAAVVVVPLRVGGGTRIKIFEAMAMGKPVVSTSIGAEGLNVEPGRHFVLADSVDQFRRQVCELLTDHDRRHRVGREARNIVQTSYSTETVARQFDNVCRLVLESANSKAY